MQILLGSTGGRITTLGASRSIGFQSPMQHIRGTTKPSSARHALILVIAGTDLSTKTPLCAALFVFATVHILWDFNRTAVFQVTLFAASPFDPRSRGASTMRATIVKEARVRSGVCVAIRSVAFIKGTRTGHAFEGHAFDRDISEGESGLAWLVATKHQYEYSANKQNTKKPWRNRAFAAVAVRCLQDGTDRELLVFDRCVLCLYHGE
jgi:hypothetical protein